MRLRPPLRDVGLGQNLGGGSYYYVCFFQNLKFTYAIVLFYLFWGWCLSLLRLHRYHSNNDTTSGMAELKKLTFVPKIAEDMRGNLYEMKANEKKMKGNE